jgi:hypothetical protein
MNDDFPANERESTADQFQWLFNLEEIQRLFGQKISARYTASALHDLTVASFGDNAHEVRLAWQLLLDTMGPVLTGRFITSGAWKTFCSHPDHDDGTPSHAVLWRKGGESVVARRVFREERPTDIRFDVE